MATINYPANIKSDKDKLLAVYSLLEKMRLEHNRVGAIARSNWNEVKWSEYSKIYTEKSLPLLQEAANIRDAIRKSAYTDSEWSKLTRDERFALSLELFGDKGTEKLKPTKATADALDQLKAVDFEKIKGQFIDPTVDFTSGGWTEVDTGGYLTIAASRVTATALPYNATSYHYRDYGAGHFGDFEHLYTCYVTSMVASSYCYVWSVGNTYGTWLDLYNGNASYDAFYNNAAGTYYFGIECESNDNWDWDTISIGAYRYFKINRTGTALTNYVYTDAGRTSLESQQSIVADSTTRRYLQPCFSDGESGTYASTFYVENLDLQEAAGGLSVPISTYYMLRGIR